MKKISAAMNIYCAMNKYVLKMRAITKKTKINNFLQIITVTCRKLS